MEEEKKEGKMKVKVVGEEMEAMERERRSWSRPLVAMVLAILIY